MRSGAALIGRGGRLLGHIHLAGKTNGDFTQDDEAILTQLAHMAAVAYDNARLYEELRESDRRKDEFLATLAHELRNPLAPIRNSIHVMRLAGHDRATIDGSRAMIERQVQQMVRLVDDLLDLSRISRGQIELRTGAGRAGDGPHQRRRDEPAAHRAVGTRARASRCPRSRSRLSPTRPAWRRSSRTC